jgi:hypothetical protein
MSTGGWQKAYPSDRVKKLAAEVEKSNKVTLSEKDIYTAIQACFEPAGNGMTPVSS